MRVREYYEGKTGEMRQEFLLSRSEQESEYERCCNMVTEDPRWVLDHLEGLDEFQVNWKKYTLWIDGRHST